MSHHAELWNERFRQLQKYKAEHGDCNVPKGYSANPELGGWARNQRLRRKELPDDRREKLEGIGFVFDPYEEGWNEMFRQLRKYRDEHGDCNVPKRYSENRPLGRWVQNQRSRYETLPDDRKEQLKEVGLVFDPYEQKWLDQFREAKEYKEREGRWPPASGRKYRKLGGWISKQRERYKEGGLSKERIALLNDAGFEWCGMAERYVAARVSGDDGADAGADDEGKSGEVPIEGGCGSRKGCRATRSSRRAAGRGGGKKPRKANAVARGGIGAREVEENHVSGDDGADAGADDESESGEVPIEGGGGSRKRRRTPKSSRRAAGRGGGKKPRKANAVARGGIGAREVEENTEENEIHPSSANEGFFCDASSDREDGEIPIKGGRRSKRRQNLLSRLSAGTRISVYWPEDGAYYPGVIAACLPSGEHVVNYDNGHEETVDLSDETLGPMR